MIYIPNATDLIEGHILQWDFTKKTYVFIDKIKPFFENLNISFETADLPKNPNQPIFSLVYIIRDEAWRMTHIDQTPIKGFIMPRNQYNPAQNYNDRADYWEFHAMNKNGQMSKSAISINSRYFADTEAEAKALFNALVHVRRQHAIDLQKDAESHLIP